MKNPLVKLVVKKTAPKKEKEVVKEVEVVTCSNCNNSGLKCSDCGCNG